jgi:hypothetical protein
MVASGNVLRSKTRFSSSVAKRPLQAAGPAATLRAAPEARAVVPAREVEAEAEPLALAAVVEMPPRMLVEAAAVEGVG